MGARHAQTASGLQGKRATRRDTGLLRYDAGVVVVMFSRATE